MFKIFDLIWRYNSVLKKSSNTKKIFPHVTWNDPKVFLGYFKLLWVVNENLRLFSLFLFSEKDHLYIPRDIFLFDNQLVDVHFLNLNATKGMKNWSVPTSKTKKWTCEWYIFFSMWLISGIALVIQRKSRMSFMKLSLLLIFY